MVHSHSSFLIPFFTEMNIKFHDKWSVLHSYENLPYFSESDVDMAFRSSDFKGLENLIFDVATKNGWIVLQKLWYDIEACYYFVLWDKENDVFLALDFLIDNKGIGCYGFSTLLLTTNCVSFKKIIPVPNHEVAFLYKFSKRLIKKRDLNEDFEYLNYHYSLSDNTKLFKTLENRFGNKYLSRLKKQFDTKQYDIDENFRLQLLRFNKFSNQIQSIFLNFKRISNRILNPFGIIIYIPLSNQNEMFLFKSILETKMDIAFRHIIVNDSFLTLKKNIIGFAGNSLVICKCKKTRDSRIIWAWGESKNISNSLTFNNNLELLAETYKFEIIKILIQRMIKRRIK